MLMPDTIHVMLSLIIIVFLLLLFLLLVLSLLLLHFSYSPFQRHSLLCTYNPPLLHVSSHCTLVYRHRTRRTATTPRSCDSAFTVAVTPGTGGKTAEVWR